MEIGVGVQWDDGNSDGGSGYYPGVLRVFDLDSREKVLHFQKHRAYDYVLLVTV